MIRRFFVEDGAGEEPAVGVAAEDSASGAEVAADHLEVGEQAAVDLLLAVNAFFFFDVGREDFVEEFAE